MLRHTVLCWVVLRTRLCWPSVVSSAGGVASLACPRLALPRPGQAWASSRVAVHGVAGFEQLEVVLEAVLVRSDQGEP